MLTPRRKQAVSTHNQELEALEARLRETEERLKRAKSSPPGSFSRKNSQRRTPIGGTFNEEDKARVGGAESSRPLAQKQRPDVKQAASTNANAMPGALPETPTSYNSSAEYVMVDRPQSARRNNQERQ